MLNEQVRTLENHLGERLAPLGVETDLLWEEINPLMVDAALDERVAFTRQLRSQIETDLSALDDPRRRSALFKEMRQADIDFELATLDSFPGFDDPFLGSDDPFPGPDTFAFRPDKTRPRRRKRGS